MDDLRFNLQNIWSLRNENGDSISLSPFNGRVSLVVFKKGSSKPDVKMPVSTAYSLRWTAIAKELMMATPGIKIPFVQMRYDPQAKQTVKELTIVFAKDEKGCYYLEVQSPKMSPVRFNIKSSGMYSNGSDPMTDEERSSIGLQEFSYVLKSKIHIAEMLSTFGSRQQQGSFGNKGGNRNFGDHGNGGGNGNVDFKKSSAPADPFGDVADIF